MPVSLGRIEREFVVGSLRDNPQPLAVFAGERFANLSPGSYEIRGETIESSASSLDFARDSASVTVFFRHRKRGMFFLSGTEIGPDGAVLLQIPGDVFMEDNLPSARADCALWLDIGGAECIARSSAAFPPFTVVPDPLVLRDREGTLGALLSRAGMEDGGPRLSYRLFEFAERIRSKGRGEGERNAVIYADHRYIVASLDEPQCGIVREGLDRGLEGIGARFSCGNRTISVTANLAGLLPVTRRDCIVGLDVKAAQPEDKRFLYEQANREKFRG